MTVIEVKDINQYRDIIENPQPAVFDFWATWCGPCRFISPVFEQLSERSEFANVRFFKVDVDAAQDISRELRITAMPTFKLVKGGKVAGEVVGANPAKLMQLLQSVAPPPA